MRRTLAVLLIATLLAPGCATARMADTRFTQPSTASLPDRALLTAYLERLPAGSKVRASLASGKTVRGTLMQATNEGIVVQRRTRIPEPPVTIPIESIRAVEIDTSSGTGRAVAIGAAAGGGAALGVILILAAIFAGD
jgi:hypothetical protein